LRLRVPPIFIHFEFEFELLEEVRQESRVLSCEGVRVRVLGCAA